MSEIFEINDSPKKNEMLLTADLLNHIGHIAAMEIKVQDANRLIDGTDLDADEASMEEKISELLNNKETVERLNKFPDELRDGAIGLLVEYKVIFPDCDNFNEYLDSLKAIESRSPGWPGGEKTKILIEHISKELTRNGLEPSEEEVANYFTDNYVKNGYFFHSFNGAFEDSIKQRGLDVDTRFWDWDELKDISDICSKAGYGMVLGWSGLNCRGKLSIGDSASNIYRYGIASPEWFGQFVAEGWHIPNKEPYDKKAFYKKDYENAKNNIMLFCDRKMHQSSEEDIENRIAYPNMTFEEGQAILAFFEKYWQKFASKENGSKCALIKRSAVGRDVPVISYKDYCEKYDSDVSYTMSNLQDYINMISDSGHNDLQISEPISPEDIKIVSLPNYLDIHNI